MNAINDTVFGSMSYVRSWERTDKQIFFGRELDVKIVAEAYEGQGILDVQRNAYKKYLENIDQYIRNTHKVLLKYYLDNYDVIAETIIIPDKINKENINEELIVRLIRVKSIYFDRKGQFGWLCDCAWDEEHGICILLSDDMFCVKEQDYFL